NILLGLPNSGYAVPFSVFKVDPATATDSFANSVAFGPEGTLVATVVLSVSILLVWLRYRKSAAGIGGRAKKVKKFK
ncbi:MAG: hypothetical protein Q4C06_04810, partial [Bacillota bacterium]|nr:hypothetical protein [Bacillota bacterium]